jgi:hypothetical protein
MGFRLFLSETLYFIQIVLHSTSICGCNIKLLFTLDHQRMRVLRSPFHQGYVELRILYDEEVTALNVLTTDFLFQWDNYLLVIVENGLILLCLVEEVLVCCKHYDY